MIGFFWNHFFELFIGHLKKSASFSDPQLNQIPFRPCASFFFTGLDKPSFLSHFSSTIFVFLRFKRRCTVLGNLSRCVEILKIEKTCLLRATIGNLSNSNRMQ